MNEPNASKGAFTLAAYRGAAGERPENAPVAFEHAQQLSSKIVLDLDVRLSRDEVPVVIHDKTLDRTTDGTGLVAELALGEPSRFDAGHRFAGPGNSFPYRGRDVRIPTLKSVLRAFPSARFIVDLRADDPRYPPRIIDVVESCAATERVINVSEHDAMIVAFRRQRPHWRYAAAAREVRRMVIGSKLRLQRWILAAADFFMIPESHNGTRVLDRRLLREVHRRGKHAWIWTINDPASAVRLREFGVDGAFTEYPQRMAALV